MNNKITIEKLKSRIIKEKDSIIKEYFQYLSFPSISSEPGYKGALIDCSNWLADYLKKLNFHVEIWSLNDHHPVVFGHYDKAGPDKPTLMIYNHYDVQPIDPIEEWLTPPFQPTLKNDNIYARGAQDNKGQSFYVLAALKLYLEEFGTLPINIKICIEGEEEMGSDGLSKLLKDKSEKLKAHYLAIVDLGLRDERVPAVTLGIRGLVTLDVEIKGSNVDLHSGSHGGIVFNPIHALVHLLSSVRDQKGKITIPGFYDKVIEMPIEDQSKVSFTFDVTQYQKKTGAYASGGEKEYSVLERNWLRPTLEINGIAGGYSGKGFKTVIPAKATAKISCRLVPNQDPKEIGELVSNYLKANCPQGVDVSVQVRPGTGKAVRTTANAKVVEAFSKAFNEIFNMPCEFIFEGASIPIVTELAEECEGEVILLGLGLDTDNIHAPNEHFSFSRIEKGILILCRAFEIFANK